jgi:hypothetical protein
MEHQINRKQEHVGPSGGQVALAKNKDAIEMRVPYGYRLDPDRYLYVTRFVPLPEDAEQMGRYKRRLQKLLADPSEAILAARRLEAMGRDCVQPLRQGLTHEHPMVRFASAESLAYLGDLSGIDELGKLAQRHPLLAGACLNALASLDEPGCRRWLSELLSDGDPVLRAAAFGHLRELAERDPPEPKLKTTWGGPYREYLVRNLGGELLNDSFWLHHVAPKSERLVCFSADSRAEVVLFGDGIALTGPVRTLIGNGQDFSVSYEPGVGQKCILKRISPQGNRQAICPPTLEDVIRTLAELGAEYPDVVDLLRKLDEGRCLNCTARLNTPLAEVTAQMLVEAQRDGILLRDEPADAERKLITSAAAPQ